MKLQNRRGWTVDTANSLHASAQYGEKMKGFWKTRRGKMVGEVNII